MRSNCAISFIVTSRNDDHGANMIRRFRLFAESLLQQANKHGLAGELIIVEWNPPPGPRLHDVLELKTPSDIFAVRFIEVPPEAHRAIRNSDVIPLFQMIAKNVGIRRAKGEFIVATNPDLLFSDALISFLASRQLKHKVMYRIDRHDVPAEPPENASMDELLAWCQANVLRVHRKWGSFPPGSRWRLLFQQLSPDAWLGRPKRVAETCIGALRHLRGNARRQLAKCITMLDLRRLFLYWSIGLSRRLSTSCSKFFTLVTDKGSWPALKHAWRSLFKHLSLAALRLRQKVQRRIQVYGMKARRLINYLKPRTWLSALRRSRVFYWLLYVIRPILNLGVRYLNASPKIHTNGCGDFTLLSRQNWFALRGYPELPIWSMHIDSLLCYMAVASGAAEQVLNSPQRIYHMEHENSWVVLSPEERLRIFAKKPWIDVSLLTDIWNSMLYTRRPIVYNDDNWGLADQPLDEVLLRGGEKQVIKRGLAAWAATGS